MSNEEIKSNAGANASADVPDMRGESFGLARSLAWVSLFLVLGLAVLMSVFTGNMARDVLLSKQRDFASLLAENLNNTLYRRFTLPTAIGFGRIELRNPVQYERLDQVVQAQIHGMNVEELRIYDHNGTITYATNPELAGTSGMASPSVEKSRTMEQPIFDVDRKVSYLETFFAFSLPPGSFYMRTTMPLRIENRLGSSEAEGPIMGVLEFSQDVTADMVNVTRFQWSIITFTLLFSLLFVTLLIVFMRRAERALAARVLERQRLVSQLHENERLAGMGRVISGIAHEIRNPLGIIRSSADLLLKRNSGQDDAVTRNILIAIHDESKRLSQTVTDFLDYARPRKPNYTEVNLGQILDEALGFMEPEMQRLECKVERHYDSSSNDLCVEGDKGLIYRAIYNILSNAAQAMHDSPPQERRIKVEAARRQERAPKGAHPIQSVEVCVTDNGSGFGNEDKARFLDPFFTTKDSGTGLGLAIVNSIISSHSGRLFLENASPAAANTAEGCPPEGRISYAGGRVRIVLPVRQAS